MPAALILLLSTIVLTVIVAWPLPRKFPSADRGSGQTVVLEPMRPPSNIRALIWMVVTALCAILLIGLKFPNIIQLEHQLVELLSNSVLHQPLLVDRFAQRLVPVVPVAAICYGVATAIVFNCTVGRRLMILANVALFVIVAAFTDTLLCIVVVKTGFPLGPTPVVSVIIHYAITRVLFFRLAWTTFQLPHKTPVPLKRGSNLRDDLVLWSALAGGLAVVAVAATFLIQYTHDDFMLQATLLVGAGSMAIRFAYVFLGLIRMAGPKHPDPDDRRPPIEVIIPAYNEELNMPRLLHSLDRAAVRYGGPVRVILCDDGSTDDTIPIAQAVMDSFLAATGEIIHGQHAGKSAALNQALAICEADIVFRVDGDCEIEENSLLYAVPWFLNYDDVGLVGAVTIPKEPYTTWIDRMRLLELLPAYGFTRLCLTEVDALQCVPGTFTGMRREVALEVGGFIQGMYGEDVDFTCACARLGYRAICDSRVISYEDVPNTMRQLRIQRIRWNWGGVLACSRFDPFGCGFQGPRFWFMFYQVGSRRLSRPFHVAGIMFLIAYAVFQPGPGHSLLRVGGLLLAWQFPGILQAFLVLCYYRRYRELPWMVMWYFFAALRMFFALDANLCFRARPVATWSLIKSPPPTETLTPALVGAGSLPEETL